MCLPPQGRTMEESLECGETQAATSMPKGTSGVRWGGGWGGLVEEPGDGGPLWGWGQGQPRNTGAQWRLHSESGPASQSTMLWLGRSGPTVPDQHPGHIWLDG